MLLFKMRKSARNFILTDSLKTLNHLKKGRRINDMANSNTFEDLRKYKEENNLCTKHDLIKIWQTQKLDFWIKDQNISYEEYYVGKRLILLFKMTDVNKVKEFLDDLASKSNTRQSAYQSYIMLKTTGYSWASKKPSWKENIDNAWKNKDNYKGGNKNKINNINITHDEEYMKLSPREKMKRTNLERYGCEFPQCSQEIKDKIKQRKIELYGEDYGKIFSLRSKESMLKTDGNLLRLGHNHNEDFKRYSWRNETFDSKWEIYYWQYLTDDNVDFEFQPSPIEYFHEGKKHKYYPDFKIGNEYIEVKNDSLLKLMINGNGKEHSKYLCMLENNVKILLQKDILPYKKYFQEHYDESEIIETKKRIYRNLINYFEFKCLETNKTYNSIEGILEIMEFCCPKNKNPTTLRGYIKECCEGKKKNYKNYHFEYV